MRLLRFTVLLSIFLATTSLSVFADAPASELLKMFPDHVGTFRRTQSPGDPGILKQQGILDPSFEQLGGEAEYIGTGNQRFLVEIIQSHQDAEAYSLLSVVAAMTRLKETGVEISAKFGTAGFASSDQIGFFKGLHFVRITNLNKSASAGAEDLAKGLAETFDKGEGDIPALVKHLPNPDQAQKTAVFLTRFSSLQTLLPNQVVLSAIDPGGDADAAFVNSGAAKVLVVEFHTPQLAKDNDDRIIAKIHELWNSGQAAPTGYKRVGNYSVFVFDAPDDAAAKQLMGQVHYEQLIQWLGQNPNLYKEAERQYVETTLGVFIAVLKASGYALVGCLGLGGIFGALLFNRRRAQQKAQQAYSDAGGMLRLNIDELSPQTDPARLLGPGR